MNPIAFKNKSGYVVPANDYLIDDWKNLELMPIYGNDNQQDQNSEEAELLEKFTVAELKAKCKAAGLSGYSKMNESELIAALAEV